MVMLADLNTNTTITNTAAATYLEWLREEDALYDGSKERGSPLSSFCRTKSTSDFHSVPKRHPNHGQTQDVGHKSRKCNNLS